MAVRTARSIPLRKVYLHDDPLDQGCMETPQRVRIQHGFSLRAERPRVSLMLLRCAAERLVSCGMVSRDRRLSETVYHRPAFDQHRQIVRGFYDLGFRRHGLNTITSALASQIVNVPSAPGSYGSRTSGNQRAQAV